MCSCEFCGEEFASSQATARFCGATCRMRAFRERRARVETSGDAGPVFCVLLRELEESGQTEGWESSVALLLARRIDSCGSAIGLVQLVKLLLSLMGELRSRRPAPMDSVEEFRQRFAERHRVSTVNHVEMVNDETRSAVG